jgi:hypothetical protein
MVVVTQSCEITMVEPIDTVVEILEMLRHRNHLDGRADRVGEVGSSSRAAKVAVGNVGGDKRGRTEAAIHEHVLTLAIRFHLDDDVAR